MRNAWALVAALLTASVVAPVAALAADVGAGYLQGPGGYYSQTDHSGPYAVGSDGTMYLIGKNAATGNGALPPQGVTMTVTNNPVQAGAVITPLQPNANRKYINVFNSTGGVCRYGYGTGSTPYAPSSTAGMPLLASTGLIMESSAITYQSVSFWCAQAGTVDVTEGQ